MKPRYRVKVMWDYDAFPVWSVGHREWQASVESLPISESLRAALQRWSDEWTAAMCGDHGPDSSRWRAPSEEKRAAWDAKGRKLLAQLRAELGPDFEVGYRNETTGEDEWPGSA